MISKWYCNLFEQGRKITVMKLFMSSKTGKTCFHDVY